MLAAMFPGMTEERIVHKIVADQQQQPMEMQQVRQAIAASQAAGAMVEVPVEVPQVKVVTGTKVR